jgi:hypothetical protein
VARLFGWEASRLAALCANWAAKGDLLAGVRVKGWPGDYLAIPRPS